MRLVTQLLVNIRAWCKVPGKMVAIAVVYGHKLAVIVIVKSHDIGR